MWKKIKDSEYYLSFKHDTDYEIYVTDYIAVWSILYSKKSFLTQLKDSNDELELENDNDYIVKGIHLLSNPDRLRKTNIKKEENGNSLFVSLKMLQGFIFSFESKFVKCSEEIYFEKITQPLLKTIVELHASQLELRHELKRKDVEINEYKRESDEKKVFLRVSRKTQPFNDEEYMNKYKSYQEHFGSTDIPTSLLEKSFKTAQINIKQEATAVSTVKQESNNIKQEPKSVKLEPNTPALEEPSPSKATITMNCKQEASKTERPSQTSNNDRRKRLKKLNF